MLYEKLLNQALPSSSSSSSSRKNKNKTSVAERFVILLRLGVNYVLDAFILIGTSLTWKYTDSRVMYCFALADLFLIPFATYDQVYLIRHENFPVYVYMYMFEFVVVFAVVAVPGNETMTSIDTRKQSMIWFLKLCVEICMIYIYDRKTAEEEEDV